jgi:hypothetical protein
MRPGDAQAERERQESADREARRAQLRRFLEELEVGQAPATRVATETSAQDDLSRPVEETLRLMWEQQSRGYLINLETGEVLHK